MEKENSLDHNAISTPGYPPIEWLFISNINYPQHEGIQAIWHEYQKLSFSEPLSEWMTPELFLYYAATSPVHLWQPVGSSWELLAGFRTFNLSKTVSIQILPVLRHHKLTEIDAIKIAIHDVITPLFWWGLKSSKSGQQVHNFCRKIRKCLPEDLQKVIPRPSELKTWLGLSPHQGRISPAQISKLVQIRNQITERQQTVQAASNE